ncbi:MAG: chromate transporter [Bacteroidota bacterium]
MVRTRRIRYIIFLRDVLVVSLMAFGGPQAHMVLFLDTMVRKRAYLTEAELMELYALCQILPGPTSTQTLTAIGFRIGGPPLAYLTLLVWALPAVTIMIIAGLVMSLFAEQQISTDFTRFIQPIAVGFVAFAAYRISSKVVATNLGYFLMIASAIIAYFFPSPFVFPGLLVVGGGVTMLNYRKHAKEPKTQFKIVWTNFFIWAGVFVGIAALGLITKALPLRLFENFYRNGSLIFGGGQVLIPLLYTEFVEFKHYLNSQEFLSGLAFAQSVPALPSHLAPS